MDLTPTPLERQWRLTVILQTERLTRMRYVTAVLVAILAAFVLARAFPARAQSLEEGRAWIHANDKTCCPHDRCFPVTATPGLTHWIIPGFTSEVRIRQERRWPFPRIYGCAYAHDPTRIRCLYIPTPEQS